MSEDDFPPGGLHASPDIRKAMSVAIPPGETRTIGGFDFFNNGDTPVHVGHFESWVQRIQALKKDLELLGCVVNVRIGGEAQVASKKPRTKTDKRKATRGGGKKTT